MSLAMKFLIALVGLATAIVTLMTALVSLAPDDVSSPGLYPTATPTYEPDADLPGWPEVDRYGYECGAYSADPACW